MIIFVKLKKVRYFTDVPSVLAKNVFYLTHVVKFGKVMWHSRCDCKVLVDLSLSSDCALLSLTNSGKMKSNPAIMRAISSLVSSLPLAQEHTENFDAKCSQVTYV